MDAKRKEGNMITSAATALKVLGVNPTYAEYIAQPLEHHYIEAANDFQATGNDDLRDYFLSAAVSRAQQARKDYLASEKEIIAAELIHDDTYLRYVETYCNDTNLWIKVDQTGLYDRKKVHHKGLVGVQIKHGNGIIPYLDDNYIATTAWLADDNGKDDPIHLGRSYTNTNIGSLGDMEEPGGLAKNVLFLAGYLQGRWR